MSDTDKIMSASEANEANRESLRRAESKRTAEEEGMTDATERKVLSAEEVEALNGELSKLSFWAITSGVPRDYVDVIGSCFGPELSPLDEKYPVRCKPSLVTTIRALRAAANIQSDAFTERAADDSKTIRELRAKNETAFNVQASLMREASAKDAENAWLKKYLRAYANKDNWLPGTAVLDVWNHERCETGPELAIEALKPQAERGGEAEG